MTDTRQPRTREQVLDDLMAQLEVDTPTDLLRAVADLRNDLYTLENQPDPLLAVDHDGRIRVRKDVTLRGLVSIIDALQNMRVAGS